MSNQFHFKNFEPDFKLRFQANLIVNRILDSAPVGAFGVGLLEKEGESSYRCALDIFSSHGPFMASAVSATPEQALEGLENRINRQIDWWKSHRGGKSSPPSAFQGAHPALAAGS
jgi:hypothetical protein